LDYARHDAQLARLAPTGGELNNQLTNHAPMVIEALCALGRGAAAPTWLDRYASHLLPRPPHVAEIREGEWRSALGDPQRESDWRHYFERETATLGWRPTLRQWLPRLAPGFAASAAHGAIRTGHAIRALGVEDTAARRDELAGALGYWAACYRSLPFGDAQDGALSPADAIERVPRLPAHLRRHEGSIDAALTPLATWAPFTPVASWLHVSPDVDSTIDALASTFARAYLANATTWLECIVFVHAVTSIGALAHMVAHVDVEDARAMCRFAWQTGAALYSAYGRRPPAADDAVDAGALTSPKALVDRAIETGDEHAIKVTEACLFFHRRRPHPAFYAVAAHATRTLGA